jgi:hypothetical protein
MMDLNSYRIQKLVRFSKQSRCKALVNAFQSKSLPPCKLKFHSHIYSLICMIWVLISLSSHIRNFYFENICRFYPTKTSLLLPVYLFAFSNLSVQFRYCTEILLMSKKSSSVKYFHYKIISFGINL